MKDETHNASTRTAFFAVRLSFFAVFLSLVVCVFLVVAYARRPDNWAALTIFPTWIWPLRALILHFAPRVLARFVRFFSRRAKTKTLRAKSAAPFEFSPRKCSARVLARRFY